MGDIIFEVSAWIIPMVLAITLHEAAHGYMALRFGDDTALRQGRISVNPLRHVDPFGTVLLPIMLLLASNGTLTFGYAKPVPVSFWRLSPRRLGIGLVAAAGPGTNFILAVISALLLHILPLLPDGLDVWMLEVLKGSIVINLVLCLFNLIPMPPLDGGRILAALLPQAAQAPLARLERYGFLILISALFLLPWLGNQVGMDLNIFGRLVGEPALRIGDWLLRAVGV